MSSASIASLAGAQLHHEWPTSQSELWSELQNDLRSELWSDLWSDLWNDLSAVAAAVARNVTKAVLEVPTAIAVRRRADESEKSRNKPAKDEATTL